MRCAAIETIRAEHRSIATVLHGLRYFAERLPEDEGRPDCKIFRAMLYYLDAFPERFHHPKEDRYLFSRLRQRTTQAEAIISRLARDHAMGEDKIRALMQSVIRLEYGGDRYIDAVCAQAWSYSEMQFRHMGLEENIILPLAKRVLLAEDWSDIDAEFLENEDPLFGVESKREFAQLFKRILDLPRPEASEIAEPSAAD